MEVMRGIPDGAVDLVVTDPPYGINDRAFDTEKDSIGGRKGTSNTWHPKSEWDVEIRPEWCAETCRVAKTVLWFGHWRKRAEVESYMKYPIRARIVWAKDCHTGPPCPVAMQDEEIWIFSERGIKAARFDTSIWNVPMIPTWERREHKNQKPIHLMTRAVSLIEGDIILDPFAGSGTTLVAAKQLGRKYIGIEINPDYCKIADERLSQEELFG